MRPERCWIKPPNCPQDLKKWFISLTSPPANLLPAWSQTPYPPSLVILPNIISDLHAMEKFRLLSISFQFPWTVPFVTKIAKLCCSFQCLMFGSASTPGMNSFCSLTATKCDRLRSHERNKGKIWGAKPSRRINAGFGVYQWDLC